MYTKTHHKSVVTETHKHSQTGRRTDDGASLEFFMGVKLLGSPRVEQVESEFPASGYCSVSLFGFVFSLQSVTCPLVTVLLLLQSVAQVSKSCCGAFSHVLIRVQSSCSGSRAASLEAAGSVYVPGVRSLLCRVVYRAGVAA